jgi:hypothetical protein
MPNSIGGAQLSALKAAQNTQTEAAPEVGQKILLHWTAYGPMYKIDGHPQVPGTYIEVEITAIKTAKLLLE